MTADDWRVMRQLDRTRSLLEEAQRELPVSGVGTYSTAGAPDDAA